MENITSQLLIEELLYDDFENGRRVKRRNREMLELIGAKFILRYEDLKLFTEYRQSEYLEYKLMIQDQISRFDKYLTLDIFSRRLLIQFPADWYEEKKEDYMPCPESFLVQYFSTNRYDVIVNFRSTELFRCSEDISVIKALCEKELVLPGQINIMSIHCMNIHKYLDSGTSEDFNVKEGYFDKKESSLCQI